MVRLPGPPHQRRLRPGEIQEERKTIRSTLSRRPKGAETLKDVRDMWSQDLSDQGILSSLDDRRKVLRDARSLLHSVPSSQEIATMKRNRKPRAVGPWGNLSKALKEKEKPPEEGTRKLSRLYFHPRVPKQVRPQQNNPNPKKAPFYDSLSHLSCRSQDGRGGTAKAPKSMKCGRSSRAGAALSGPRLRTFATRH